MMREIIKNSKNWAECEFQDFLNYIQPTKYIVRSTEYDDTYKIPVLTAGKSFIKGYTNEEDGIFEKYPVIIFDDFTTATKYVNFPFKVKSSAMKILEPSSKLVNLKFVYFAMQVNAIRSDTHKRYWISVYAKKQFFIPPLNEQNRIVAKIEELFSKLDNGIENLKTARAQLKVYRQALLKHAFEGKLTADWREQNKDKLETSSALQQLIHIERAARYQQQLIDWQAAGQKGSKPKAPKPLQPLNNVELAELPVLPEGWAYTYLAHLGDLGRGKSKHRPRNDPKLFGGKYPFIQTGEVKAAVKVIKEFTQTYSDFGLQQSKLWPKETLCITIAANIAETAFLGFEGCFPDSVVGFSAFKQTVVAEYIDYFIQAVRSRIEAYAPATAQKNINLETLENLVVPYCSLDEQNYLLNYIDERFSEIDQLEQTINIALLQSEALRQSILKKAFSGGLVAQDANDEPASVLLARIKAEIAAKPANKRLSKDSI